MGNRPSKKVHDARFPREATEAPTPNSIELTEDEKKQVLQMDRTLVGLKMALTDAQLRVENVEDVLKKEKKNRTEMSNKLREGLKTYVELGSTIAVAHGISRDKLEKWKLQVDTMTLVPLK